MYYTMISHNMTKTTALFGMFLGCSDQDRPKVVQERKIVDMMIGAQDLPIHEGSES